MAVASAWGSPGPPARATAASRPRSQFPIAGVGPPPDAPLPQVASAEIQPGGAIIAGRPTQVAVVLRPKAAWEPGAFTMPDRLFVQVRIPRGATLASVPATLADAAEGRYLATITLPDPGPYILEVAATADFLERGPIRGVDRARHCDPRRGGHAGPGAGSGGTSDGPGPIVPAVLLLVAVLLVGGLVLVVRRSS